MLGNLFGNTAAMGMNQLTGLANQAFNQARNQYQQNQLASPQHQQAMLAQQQAAYNSMLNQRQHRYMINGRTMTFEQWLDELAPGEDNPMRTFLTLKYQE